MAVPILIEPTCLVFELAYGPFIDEKKEQDEFIRFLNDFIDPLFAEIKRVGGRIAVTAELLKKYEESVPVSVYYQSSIAKLARETYGRELFELAQVVHEFGQHPHLNARFEDQYVGNTCLIAKEMYTQWIDLAVLAVINRLPKCILKSTQKSIFLYDTAVLITENNLERLQVMDSLTLLTASTEYSTYLISEYLRNKIEKDMKHIPCHGTGTHSSMWDNKIKSINDIEKSHRSLFFELLKTGLVNQIIFTDFPQQTKVIYPPTLELDRVTIGETSDILHCTLRGRGTKSNSQFVHLTVLRGLGDVIIKAFGGNITLEKLKEVNGISEAAATTM